MSKSDKKCSRQFDPQRIAESAGELYDTLRQFQNDRYQSWEHCYMAFHEAFENKKAGKQDEVDIDKLCLHLAFYLASWGMYRGSSFLFRCDYKVHEEVVQSLLEHGYLHGIECKWLLQSSETLESLCKLYRGIKGIYGPYCEDVKRRQEIWEAKYEPAQKERNKR